MNTREIRKIKANLKLSEKQKSILVGLMLGDGCLESINGFTFRLKIEQSLAHKEYVDWLYKNFKDFVLTEPKIKTKMIGEKTYQNYGFQTISCGNLRFFAHQFYKKNLAGKKVPKLIKRLLDPLALAIWFMDDGQIKSKKHKALLINTQCFFRKDLKLLRDALRDKFGIETTLKKEKKGFRIYLLSKTLSNFLKVVSPFILSSMRYKFGINIMPKK